MKEAFGSMQIHQHKGGTMDNTNIKYTYVEYDEVWKNDDFPKSRGQFMSKIVKENIREFKKKFPKNLIIPILTSIIVFVAVVVALAMGVNSFYMGYLESLPMMYHFVPYLVPGIVDGKVYIEGFSHYNGSVNTLWIVYPLYFIAAMVIRGLFKTIFGKKQLKELFINIANLSKSKKSYRATCEVNTRAVFAKGLLISFIIGLIVKNPFTILFLSIFFVFVYIKNMKSELVQLILMWRVTGNLKKGKLDYVSVGKLMLEMRSIAYGFFLYFILCAVMWFVLSYSIWARVILTLIFVILFVLIMFQGRVLKAAKGISIIAIIMTTVAVSSFVVFGDDGGWAESGGNFFAWLGNAGSKIIGRLPETRFRQPIYVRSIGGRGNSNPHTVSCRVFNQRRYPGAQLSGSTGD